MPVAVDNSGNKKKKGGLTDAAEIEAKINEIMIEGPGGPAQKMEVDYSETTAQQIPQAQALAAQGQLQAGLDLLLSLEKQTRTGADMHSTAKILVAIVQMCHEAQQWDLLNEHLILLSKKRSQLKAAVTKMVQACTVWIQEGTLPNATVELKLIETLRTITAGKIYVETERARLTHRLSQMQEKDGDVAAAAKTMQELQVETYGSMERHEKVELILEQMRLCLATQDYIRTQIISKKISTRFFEDPKNQALKLKYYEYMIELNQHEGTYLDICRFYRHIFDTPCIQEDETKRMNIVRTMCLYVILSPYDNEQSDLIHRIKQEKALEDIPTYITLLEEFITTELIDDAKFCQIYEHLIKQKKNPSAPAVFDGSEQGNKRWADLKKRIVEHNIRIVSMYYTRIHLKRLAELLALSEHETEDFLNAMVVKGSVVAKIDRLEGIINFFTQKNPNDMLNEWSHNISELMEKVQKTTHLINKEEMVHKHMAGKADD